ncbi:hypothetical protein MMC30_003987 [Trapelia coarctata]|nr:hypothetical protein [Trapelia coarctata]
MTEAFGIQDLHALINQTLISANDQNSYHSFCRDLVDPPTYDAAARVLASIPLPPEPSCLPLACLSYALATYPGRWPVFDLIRCHTKLWRVLHEEAKSGRDLRAIRLVATTLAQVKSSYRSLIDLLPPESERPVIREPQSQRCLTQRTLSRFIRNFSLPITHDGSLQPVVVIALPNGPLLGVACIAVAAKYTAAPINASSGAEQFRNDVLQTQSKSILVLRADVRKLGLEDPWVAESGVQVLIVEARPDMTFSATPLLISTTLKEANPRLNGPEDLSFILFTSGTSGTKKVVPLSLHNVVSGVAFVIESWGLTENDICLNMMPLNHVGGLVRNLFAPILAGGATICCPAFDPNLFWDVVEEQNPTWYYASPSMHSTILAEAKDRANALAKSRMRLICNAAGGLLPSLALQLRDTFKCIVLPSYGMTECMPISTPPLGYKPDRTGTSGISVGPELAILDGNGSHLSAKEVGRITVRGAPVFPGYLKAGSFDTSVFTRDGWFDTGDMGYLDQDGYLYISGRSKEVVNRGGELISPFEVEEAIMVAAKQPDSPIYNRVSEVLVFSAPHDVLQEVVGVVLVTPPGAMRPDLRQLHEAVKLSLHQPKWPFVIVYMDGVPKNNNKLLRMRLGDRLGFEPLSDDMRLADRHFQAGCPPPNTPLNVRIDKSVCEIDTEPIYTVINRLLKPPFQVHININPHDGFPEVIVASEPGRGSALSHTDATFLTTELRDSLDGNLVPSSINYIDSPFPLNKQGYVDTEKLKAIISIQNHPDSNQGDGSIDSKIRQIFASILSCAPKDIAPQADFFDMGGDSLKAGRLLSMLRKELQVRIPIGVLFQNSRIDDLCKVVQENLPQCKAEETQDSHHLPLPGCTTTYSSTRPLMLFIHLIPIGLLYPMKRALNWTAFLYFMSFTITMWQTHTILIERFLNLLIAMFFAKILTQICSPVFGIALKWLIIGRYKEGIYPMWGSYHTRWWFVEKSLAVTGKGIFQYTDYTTLLYYRLLGAKIGKGVSIAKGTVLGEYDLLDIGDNVTLDTCTCRPFAAERNTSMYLRRIVLGRNSSIGLKSIVAPGTILPDDTCIGPNSSTWEMRDATEANRDVLSKRVPKPHAILSLLIGLPVKVLVGFVALLPWMGGLIGIILEEPERDDDTVASVAIWFSNDHRIGFHFLAKVLDVSAGPFVFFSMVILVRYVLDKSIGKTKPGSAHNRSQMQKFRMSLMSSLIPKGDLGKLTDLFGAHYEFTSMVVRALGGKVGSRVYWPGNGPTIQDFDLIDVGDNVVFGSRSHIVTSDGTGSQKVTIGDNAMVADRVVILPGTTLGKNTVLGSGALTRRDTYYPSDTVWVGSKAGGAIRLSAMDRSEEEPVSTSQRTSAESGRSTPFQHSSDNQPLLDSRPSTPFLDPHDLEREILPPKRPSVHVHSYSLETLLPLGTKNEMLWEIPKADRPRSHLFERKAKKPADPRASPFGKAFYEGQATYHVFGMPIIFLYSIFTNIFVTIYWNIAPISAIQVLAKAMKAHPSTFGPSFVRPLAIYCLFLSVVILVMAFQALLALGIVIGAKWALMGRRMPGKYDWDTSSYCQRWQLLLTIERLRRHCYGGNGIIGLLTGTHFAVLYIRALGGTVGKDCALWAGGHTSLLFTEPDLLTLGDRVTVDDASLVAHVNSRGNFSLNALSVGDRSVLRSGSRLLSGAQMGEDACLLEHTLVMAGDVVDTRATYQGWPAEEYVGDRGGPDVQVEVGGKDEVWTEMGEFREMKVASAPA